MKKIIYLISFICLMFLVGCNKNNDSTFNKIPNYFYFPIEVDNNLEFPDIISIDGKDIALTWNTSDNAISPSGEVTRSDKDVVVTISVTANIDNESKSFDLITVTVLKREPQKYTISYDLNGGTCTGLVKSFYENEIVNLPTPKKDGYVFTGWYQGEEKIETIGNRDYHLQAHYVEGKSNISISLDEDIIYVGTEALVSIDGYNDLSCFDITSSNEDVAYIDSDYYLIGLKKGKTLFTFTLKEEPSIYGYLEVEVLNRIPVLIYKGSPIKTNDSFNIELSHYNDIKLFDINYDNEYLSYDGNSFKALKEGSTRISYILKSDSSTIGSIDMTIYPHQPVLSLSTREITIGTTTRIDVLNYDDMNAYKIEVSPEDVEINGRIIKPLKRGDYHITVTLINDETLSSSLDIHVLPLTPKVELTQNDILVGEKAYLFFDNLDELDDNDINNYDVIIEDKSIVSFSDNVFTALAIGETNIIIKNKNDDELQTSLKVNVFEKQKMYDEENEIGYGKLFIKHKTNVAFDGRIHAGDMDYLTIDGAHDLTKYDWISSNNRALVVFEDGRYIAIEKGEAVVLVVRKTNKEVIGRLHVRVYGEPDVDYISRLIKIAESQLGYVEGPDNDTKYGRWYGIPNGEWCAMYVSWCANQAGISTEIIPKYASCQTGREWFETRGLFKYKEEYTPKAGDIIFFLSNGAGHTGIVINCIGSRVYTIEGNTSDMCAKRSYDLYYNKITGYGTPNYPPYSGTSSSGDTSGSSEGSGHSTH